MTYSDRYGGLCALTFGMISNASKVDPRGGPERPVRGGGHAPARAQGGAGARGQDRGGDPGARPRLEGRARAQPQGSSFALGLWCWRGSFWVLDCGGGSALWVSTAERTDLLAHEDTQRGIKKKNTSPCQG